MAIIRAIREHNYTVINNKVFQRNQLSWQAMGMLSYLLSKPDDWSVVVNELINVTKDTAKPTGNNGVYNILKELKEKGFVQVRKNGDGTTDYIIFDTPNQANPNQANPNQANPNQAETTLVNTDIYQVLKDSKDGDVEGEVSEASESAKPININIGDFAITDDWEPEDKKAFNAKLHRSQIPSLEDKRIKDALIEFTGYWAARGDTQTQAMWEHKFFQSLTRLKARGELGAAKQDPSHKRFETRTADGMPVVKKSSGLRPLEKF